MSRQFKVEVVPDGGQLRLMVYADGLPPTGLPLNRNHFSLAQQDVAALRRGEAPLPLVQQVSAALSQWLLSNDLNALLMGALNQPNGEPLRVVFSINDEHARAEWDDLPIELVMLQGGGVPLAVRPKVASILHLLPKVGTPANTSAGATWPMRILIVRSNPPDLGGGVPEAIPIRDAILALRPELDATRLHVDVLSREMSPGVVGLPTLAELLQRLKAGYDVLVFLGHGDVLQTHQGLAPVGVLQFESADGSVHVSVPADRLAVLLHNWPVPVVLIVGCLTATDINPAMKPGVVAELPTWIKGSQGVAQALVNSESGVQVAVGMRYRLESQDATAFLHAFFRSLLSDRPGDVEVAVRLARVELNAAGQPGSWSAPVVFSSLPPEPMFAFLSTPPSAACPPVDVQHQAVRNAIWADLAGQAWSRRSPDGIASLTQLLGTIDQQIVASALPHSALVLPGWAKADPGKQAALPVVLHGPLDADVLKGTLVVGSSDALVSTVQATQPVLDGGFDVLASTGSNRSQFRIERRSRQGPLPAGPLFTATIVMGAAASGWYPVGIEMLEADPARAVCPGSNAVIIPPA